MRHVIIQDVSVPVAEALLVALNKAFAVNVVADMVDGNKYEISTEQQLNSLQLLSMTLWAEGFSLGFNTGRQR
jgi:hypothetical protein